MPIYEYYCPDNHTVYQFYAKTLAQGQTIPPCPANPRFRMRKVVSAFAIARPGRPEPTDPAGAAAPDDPVAEARMDAAMNSLEKEFDRMDENDPRAMARMMRRMAEAGGDTLDERAEEVVRRLEEGADPEAIEAELGGGEGDDPAGDPLASLSGPGEKKPSPKEPRHRFRARRLLPPRRDPTLYDY